MGLQVKFFYNIHEYKLNCLMYNVPKEFCKSWVCPLDFDCQLFTYFEKLYSESKVGAK